MCVCSSAELDAKVEGQGKWILFLWVLWFCFKKFVEICFYLLNFFCSFSIVVWGVLTQKKPFAGKLCAILNFSFLFPTDKHTSCPTSTRFLCVTSEFWQSCVADTFKLSGSDHKLKSSFVLCHKNRTCIAVGALLCNFCFCWSLLHSITLVCGKANLAAALLLFRSSSSVEKLCSLFVDCGYRFVPYKNK